MRIGDRAVRSALETIISELESAEQRIQELQNEVSTLEGAMELAEVENHALKQDMLALQEEVKRLDDALADTYIAQLDPKAKREDETD